AQAGPKASKAAVSLDEATDESDGVGDVRNPFKQKHVPKAEKADMSTGSEAATPSSGSTSSGGSTPSGGGSDSTGGTTPTTPTDDTTTKKTDVDVSHVSLHLGPVGALVTYKDVARLSPLPSAGNPLFVFTGVLKDGKTAVLLPSSTVQIGEESDVECKPSNKSCQKLELEQDDTVFFKIAGDATGTQYQLDVISVRQKSGGSAKATAAALQRHSKAGAATLRDAHVYGSSEYRGAADYRWLPDEGVLERVPEHGTGAAAASAGDAAAALPGLPVWHWRDDS
ncbi:MAG TPA: hypothetical protein VK510_06405, partial [Solirubrobacteraceae bacterium]|nr:hypothetical protein [Solirubrobacteraceae bacterium]